MTYVLLIWFSLGVAPIEHFDNSAPCFKRRSALVPLYAKTYVVRSIGCFPSTLVVEAAQTKPRQAAQTR